MKITNIRNEGGTIAHVRLEVDGVPCEVVKRDGPNGPDSELVVQTVRGRWDTETGVVWENKVVLRGDAVPQEVHAAVAEARKVAIEENIRARRACDNSPAPPEMLPGPHFLGRE